VAFITNGTQIAKGNVDFICENEYINTSTAGRKSIEDANVAYVYLSESL
jgi:hypothetical protein